MVKNVIILNDFAYADGGASKVALTSANLLANSNINVIFLCAVKNGDFSELSDSVKVVCLEQFDILHNPNRLKAILQGLWNKKANKCLSSLLKMYSPLDTVVHVHTWTKALSPAIWKVLSLSSFNVLVTTHDYFLCCPNGGLYNYRKRKICGLKPLGINCFFCNCDSRSYIQKIWRYSRQVIQNYWLYRNTKLWILPISYTTQILNEKLFYGKVKGRFLLNNPVELNKCQPVEIKQEKAYLYVGRISLEKGVDLFCTAITSLHKKAIVIGDGYLKAELEEKYPNIQFVGWLTGYQKEQYVRKGKALVFPSLWYEGAPLTIQEMKSYGIPCIVPDRCAASEQIEDGKTGYIFKTGDLESLKEAIMKYENTDLAQMQKNLLESFHPEELSMETHLKRLVGIYNEILENDEK